KHNYHLFNCTGEDINPFLGTKEISKYWENINNQTEGWWKAPDGIFWICEKRAYAELPASCKGSCTLGIIQPGFFLLPLEDGDELRIPL
ncbi:ENR1 protein, partial [Fregetta grallaria]|nr:ENR1 protein [Fregetta grallaria]